MGRSEGWEDIHKGSNERRKSCCIDASRKVVVHGAEELARGSGRAAIGVARWAGKGVEDILTAIGLGVLGIVLVIVGAAIWAFCSILPGPDSDTSREDAPMSSVTPAAAPAPRATGGAAPSAATVTGGAGGSGQMNGKALIYYRKAEMALRRGDLKGALLQMKMAIAGDPQSQFLRTALVEIQTELGKSGG